MSAVPVLASDPDLLGAVEDPVRRRSAGEELLASELMLEAGEQLDVGSIADSGGLGLLILSGYVVREIAIADRVAAELTGPEDLLYTSHMVPGEELLHFSVQWSALVPTRLALLDRDFTDRASHWPEIVSALVQRARRPGDRAAFGHVISQLPTVDVRLLTSLWHWASSWSTVTPDGVRLAVPLSHERLARLIGARRPTITAAAGRLRDAGYVEQQRDCTWLLFSSAASLDGGRAQPGVAAPAPEGVLKPLGYRGRVPLPITRGRRSFALEQLHSRLVEQRELLRLAAERHRRQLSQLRDRSDKLRATTELSALARLARGINEHDAWPGGEDGIPEPASEEERAG